MEPSDASSVAQVEEFLLQVDDDEELHRLLEGGGLFDVDDISREKCFLKTKTSPSSRTSSSPSDSLINMLLMNRPSSVSEASELSTESNQSNGMTMKDAKASHSKLKRTLPFILPKPLCASLNFRSTGRPREKKKRGSYKLNWQHSWTCCTHKNQTSAIVPMNASESKRNPRKPFAEKYLVIRDINWNPRSAESPDEPPFEEKVLYARSYPTAPSLSVIQNDKCCESSEKKLDKKGTTQLVSPR